jgi:hypothetical protein
VEVVGFFENSLILILIYWFGSCSPNSFQYDLVNLSDSPPFSGGLSLSHAYLLIAFVAFSVPTGFLIFHSFVFS